MIYEIFYSQLGANVPHLVAHNLVFKDDFLKNDFQSKNHEMVLLMLKSTEGAH